jgi:signal transduction histidine kinase
MMLTTYHPKTVRGLPLSSSLMLIFTGAGFIAMILYTRAPANYLYYSGLILILIYGYTLIRLRFIWGAIAGLVIVGVYEISAFFFTDTSLIIFLNNSFFLISANFIGMMSSYSIEYYARRDYYMARKLEKERELVAQINVELESRVQDRTIELELKNQELLKEMDDRRRLELERLELERKFHQSQKMESLGVMAGGIAHDFNNILMSLMGNAELAKGKIELEHPLQKYLDRILKGSERARLLVQQILTFSRKKATERQVVRLHGIIDEVLKMLRPATPANIIFDIDLLPEEPLLIADPTQIHQVIVNLCTNAIQAMETESGRMTIREEVAKTTGSPNDPLLSLPAGKYIVLTIQDTGHGLDATVLPRIFEPFFTTKEQGKGTGLGLAVVHGIVSAHNGAITVESTKGYGTTFQVYLPLSDELPYEPPIESPEPRTRIISKHILLVDDQTSSLEFARDLLEDLKYTVTAYQDPLEAESAFSQVPQQFDALLTDLTMPGKTGLELAKSCITIRPDLPIILMTGYQHIDNEEIVRSAGIREILPKPFRRNELETLLDSIFR